MTYSVGLSALSYDEERFHFGLWSMLKSPLFIGGVMDRSQIPQESLEIMSNKEAIAINQDPLGKAAELVLRHTEEEWDVWAGDLSSDRKVLGVANWRNETQTVQVDLGLIGVGTARAHDVWASKDVEISGVQSFELKPHELRLLVLSDIEKVDLPQSSGYFSVADATLEGSAALIGCDEGECLPVKSKVGWIGPGAKVLFEGVESPSDGSLTVAVDFINYEYHHREAWGQGTNTRNMTITVNDEEAKRWAFPLGGNDWYESGRLTIELDGFKKGKDNIVAFASHGAEAWAPDLVGFEIFN